MRNYRMRSEKFKLRKKKHGLCGKVFKNTKYRVLVQNDVFTA